MFAREQVAQKLLRIQKRLSGLRFKIWDPWRSRKVQGNIHRKYWNELASAHPDWDPEKLKVKVGKFVTAPDNPRRIPPHSTGGSIDLTLETLAGKELDMGTGFDHFGPDAAAMYFEDLGSRPDIRDNRRTLREGMLSEDFRQDDDEWWHYDFGNQLYALHKGKEFAIYGEIVSAPR